MTRADSARRRRVSAAIPLARFTCLRAGPARGGGQHADGVAMERTGGDGGGYMDGVREWVRLPAAMPLG